MADDYKIGEIIYLKKVHPCGGNQWRITRVGSDIGLECIKCGRQILLDRETLSKRIKLKEDRKQFADSGKDSICKNY